MPDRPDATVPQTPAQAGSSADRSDAFAPDGLADLVEIGRGGMGVVFRAVQTDLGRVVAVKAVLADELSGPEPVERFRAEAAAVAAVSHPNVVQVYHVGRHRNRPYLVMEFLDGGSLADRLHAGRLRPAAAARAVEPVARAVGACHAAGILHRDLKPGNILLARNGTPKVADFGLAKAANRPSAVRTVTGAVVGTPAYMAPEQAGGTRDLTPAADVWAVGVILYEALAGRRPFHHEDLIALLIQIGTADPPPLGPEVPAELAGIVMRCLAKDPAARYPDGTALADALAGWLAVADPRGSAARDLVPLAPAPPPPPRRRRRVGRLFRPATAAAVAGLLLAGYVGWQGWAFFAPAPPLVRPLLAGYEVRPGDGPAVRVEFYHDPKTGAVLAVGEHGLAVAPAADGPAAPPEPAAGHDLPGADVRAFAVGGRLLYVGGRGGLAFADRAAKPADGPAAVHHTLGVKPPGADRPADVRVYRDPAAGGLVYVGEGGAIAAGGPATGKAGPVKPLEVLDLSHGGRSLAVAVYDDPAGGLVYVAAGGAIAAAPHGKVRAGRGARWGHALAVGGRTVDVFEDRSTGHWIYATDAGRIAVLPRK